MAFSTVVIETMVTPAAPTPQRRHFAEYLTGLMVAANKTVTGVNGVIPWKNLK